MRGRILTTRWHWACFSTDLRVGLVDLPRMAKRALLASSDFLLLLLAVWLAFSLRWGRIYWPDSWQLIGILLGAPALGCFLLWRLGLYRIATRFIGAKDAVRMYLAIGIAVLVWALLVLMLAGTGNPEFVVPRLVVLLFAVFACALVRSSRWVAAWLLEGAPLPRLRPGERRPVVIYGAGPTGVRLLEALRESRRIRADRFHRRDPVADRTMDQRLEGLS